MPVKRDKKDKLFSQIIRERSDYKCETCNKDFRETPGKLTCSHINSRIYSATKWDPDNAIAQCFGCHKKAERLPIWFTMELERIFGRRRLEIVHEKTTSGLRFNEKEKEEIYKAMKETYKKMLDDRANGSYGYMNITNWM